MILNCKRICSFWFCLVLVLVIGVAIDCCRSDVSKNDITRYVGIESTKIGDPVSKIFSDFKSKYQIERDQMTITLSEREKSIVVFEIRDNAYISEIDVYGNYVTEENIGCGSTLSDVLKTYGHGKIEPSDPGYLVWFKQTEGIMFLLNNQDIPEKLRDIPDDVFTPEQENQILAIGNARISRVKITWWDKEIEKGKTLKYLIPSPKKRH